MAKIRGRRLILSNKDKDQRKNWRNPNLPCIRAYRFGNGTTKTEIDPDYEHRYREMLMETTAHPSYKNDPTYNMRKPR